MHRGARGIRMHAECAIDAATRGHTQQRAHGALAHARVHETSSHNLPAPLAQGRVILLSPLRIQHLSSNSQRRPRQNPYEPRQFCPLD